MQCMDLVWIPTEWTKCKMTFWDKEILKEIVYPCYLGNILNCGRCDGDIVMKLKKKQGILVKWYGTSFKISINDPLPRNLLNGQISTYG